MFSAPSSGYDLEPAAGLQQATIASYALAIRSVAENAVELEPAAADLFRSHLAALLRALEQVSSQEDLHAIESSFRGELRAYRDQCLEYVARLREELAAAAGAMQTLAKGLCLSGEDHEKQLRTGLDRLRAAVSAEDPTRVQAAVNAGVAGIAEAYEQLHCAHQFIVAQLHDEIRLLHRKIDQERKAADTDPASGAWNRKKCEQRLADLLDHGDGFCAILAALSNLKQLRESHSRELIEGALKALVKRIAGTAGKDASIGRWSEEQFIVLLEMDRASSAAIARELAPQLSNKYAIQEGGSSHCLAFRVETQMVDRLPGSDPSRFRQRLDQTFALLRGA